VTDSSDSLRFIVIGSDGQIGYSLCQLLDTRQIPYLAVSSKEPEERFLELLSQNKDYPFVINCLYEEPPEEYKPDLNSWLKSCELVTEQCAQQDKVLIHVSSGLVFDGKSTRAYVETDSMDGTGDMGHAYIKMEEIVRTLNPKTIVLRASWLFSELVDNFLTRLVSAAIRQESLQFSGNLRGCPTDAHAVAKVLVGMAEQVDCGTSEPELWGIYHYADSDACSMHTFAKTVITIVKSMTEVKVETIEKGDTPDMVDAVIEPENYELSCKKVLSTFGIKQRPWRRSVHEVLKEKFSSQV
jgi:dTDP-4-dehydrorhamnose reductase